MKKLISLLVLCTPFLVHSQGIKWVENLSWSQVLEKAKKENKYVLVDCYATWCLPCKKMDKDVYPDEKVGAIVNQVLVPIKVQMDRTEEDDSRVKFWYKDAKAFEQKYKIDALPTLLFFSPEGKLVHRISAGLSLEEFLDVVSTALDPKKQYYTRLEEYKNGKRDTSIMRELVIATMNVGDNKLGLEIANQYLATLSPKNLYQKEIRDFVSRFSEIEKSKQLASAYISKLKNDDVYTKDNIEFISQFTKSSKDRGFKIFYNHPSKVNKIIDPTLPESWDRDVFAQNAVRTVIYNEYVIQAIFKPAIDSPSKIIKPDWIKLKSTIQKKFPKTNAYRIVVDAKYFWYRSKKGPEYLPTVLERMDFLFKGKDLSHKEFEINNLCWELFQNANDTVILNKAIKWMEEVFKQSAEGRKYSEALDTYANLLYKVGRTKEALEWQEKAVKTDPSDKGIQEAFTKMKNGLRTWPEN